MLKELNYGKVEISLPDRKLAKLLEHLYDDFIGTPQ